MNKEKPFFVPMLEQLLYGLPELPTEPVKSEDPEVLISREYDEFQERTTAESIALLKKVCTDYENLRDSAWRPYDRVIGWMNGCLYHGQAYMIYEKVKMYKPNDCPDMAAFFQAVAWLRYEDVKF